MSNPFAPVRTHPAALARGEVSSASASMVAEIETIGFFDLDVASGRVNWSRGAEERFGGIPRESIENFESWLGYLAPEDAERVRSGMARVAENGEDRLVLRCRFNAPDGPRLIEASGLSWFDEKFRLERISGVVLDITAQDLDKQTLARSEALLRTLISTAPDASIMIDPDGTITGFNLTAERMFGVTAQAMIGRNVSRLMPEPMASQHDEYLAAYLAGRPARVIGRARQLTGKRGDGREFPMELNVGEVRIEDERMFVAFVRDLSERFEATQRLEELREEFFRTARLNLMGTVAAGLAHELNQPLAASSNFLAAAEYILKAQPDQGGDTPELLRQAREQILLAGEIIKRLRGFLAPGGGPVERVELAALVDQASALALFGRHRFNVELDCRYASDAEVVQADRIQLLQVFVNLIRNAAGAMPDDARQQRIEVRSRAIGKWIEVTLTDSGPGFPNELLTRHNDIFRSSRGDGMGLGLTICRRIIEGLGGTIELSNARQGGARIRFTVPAFQDSTDPDED